MRQFKAKLRPKFEVALTADYGNGLRLMAATISGFTGTCAQEGLVGGVFSSTGVATGRINPRIGSLGQLNPVETGGNFPSTCGWY